MRSGVDDAGPGPVEIVVLAEHPAARLPDLEPATDRDRSPASTPDRKLETVLRRDGRPEVAADPGRSRHRRARRPADGDHPRMGRRGGPSAQSGPGRPRGRRPSAVQGRDPRRTGLGDGRDRGRARRSATATSSSCRSSCGARCPTAARSSTRGPTSILGDRHPAESRRLSDRSLPRLAIPTR